MSTQWDEEKRRNASNVANCEYLIEPNPGCEYEVLVSFFNLDGFTWKDHPDNPFKTKDIMTWKNKAELWDILQERLEEDRLAQLLTTTPDQSLKSTPREMAPKEDE